MTFIYFHGSFCYTFPTQTSTTVLTIHVEIMVPVWTASTNSLVTAQWASLEITVRLVS